MPPRKRTNPPAKSAPRKTAPAKPAPPVVAEVQPSRPDTDRSPETPSSPTEHCLVPRCRRAPETNGLCGGHYATQRGYAKRPGGDQ